MRRVALMVMLACLAVSGRAFGQASGGIEQLHSKADITAADRGAIREWLRPRIDKLVASTDPELRDMVRARTDIEAEGRADPSWSPAFIQAFGEEAVARIEAASDRAISPEARINLVTAVANLERVQAATFLLKVLTTDPYQATRYLAAKGLARIAPMVADPRVGEAVSKGIQRAFGSEISGLTFFWLFEALAKSDTEQGHDVLALGAGVAAVRLAADDPANCRALDAAVRALERAYGTDIRADGKERILMAYAVLCAWIMPPVADPGLLTALNASLEKTLNQRVGFSPGQDQVMQKLSLLEWVEKMVGEKKISRRPALPEAVEKTVKAAEQESP